MASLSSAIVVSGRPAPRRLELRRRDAGAFGARSRIITPDRAREAREGERGESYAVSRGSLWWRYDPYNGALSNEDDPETRSGIGDEFKWLLDPAPAIGLLDYEEISPGRRAGRAVLRLRAVPRDSDDFALGRLGFTGADELLLDVDAERGSLLRIECRFEGQPFSVSEVEEIAFDEDLPDETFTFTPPPGEEIRSSANQVPVWRGLTIERAVALAPFTVWIPARLPPGWETNIGFAAEKERPAMAARRPGDARARAGGGYWQPAQLHMELDGTRIDMHSNDLGADALADLAAGLVRAPAEPPDLAA